MTHEHKRVEAVEELQGLYGSFSFPERLLQKIWQRGDYDATGLMLSDGRTLKVLSPGKWNHLGGPDFSNARLVIAGREVRGDVELHLHARDWAAHGHAQDRAYDGVVLHVILFPGEGTPPASDSEKKAIATLCLLPRLNHALEEYAAEDAMEQLAGRPLHRAQESLGWLSNQELDTLLAGHAGRRWRTKVHYARERIRRLGWEAACHHAALEILGYRFNRAPMLSVAATWPIGLWRRGGVAADEVYADLQDRWSLQGVRPFNHPRRRLEQYAAWCSERPDWPQALRTHARLRGLALASARLERDTAGWRRAVGLTKCRTGLCEDLCANTVSGARFDNLTGDGFMPLVAAETGLDLKESWCGWFAGDAPESLVKILRNLGVFDGRSRPVSQGPVQGLIGWMLERDARDQQ